MGLDDTKSNLFKLADISGYIGFSRKYLSTYVPLGTFKNIRGLHIVKRANNGTAEQYYIDTKFCKDEAAYCIVRALKRNLKGIQTPTLKAINDFIYSYKCSTTAAPDTNSNIKKAQPTEECSLQHKNISENKFDTSDDNKPGSFLNGSQLSFMEREEISTLNKEITNLRNALAEARHINQIYESKIKESEPDFIKYIELSKKYPKINL